MSEPRVPSTGRPLKANVGRAGDPSESERTSYFDPLFTDVTLRPLLIVGVLILSSFGAALVTLALEDRSIWAMAALAALFGLSMFAFDTERRRGAGPRLPILLGVLWLLSIAGGLLYSTLLPA